MTELADLPQLAAELEKVLKLRSIPFGMKLFERVEDMEAIPKIRRPKAVHTTDQIVAQAARLGWTVGITAENLVGDQCKSVIGLGGQTEEWFSGKHMKGVWYASVEDTARHQAAMHIVPRGKYQALAVSPLASGRLSPPDIALFSESNGRFVVTVGAADALAFEALFGALPCRRIGTVTSTGRLTIALGGMARIDVPIAAMKSAFKGTLAHV